MNADLNTLRHTRESWLESAIDVFRENFKEAGFKLPKVIHVSVGFAYGARAESGKIMGVTYSSQMSKDRAPHVFISPEIEDTFDVLETLLHELVHVADDCRSGHRDAFITIAKSLGLTKPWTFTPSTPALAAEMVVIATELGNYPHSLLNPKKVELPTTTGATAVVDADMVPIKFTSGPGKQSTRMIKLECRHCGYMVRTTQKWISQGLPMCPQGYPLGIAW